MRRHVEAIDGISPAQTGSDLRLPGAEVKVVVCASDRLIQDGLTGYLEQSRRIVVVDQAEGHGADVLLAAVDVLTTDLCRAWLVRTYEWYLPIVFVAGEVPVSSIVDIDERVAAVHPIMTVDADRLHHSVLLATEGLAQAHGPIATTGLAPFDADPQLTDREIEVLRLIAAGLDTVEIATKLRYSARSVKYTVHDSVAKLRAQNRTQAVAVAVRAGII